MDRDRESPRPQGAKVRTRLGPARLCAWLILGTAVAHVGFGVVMGWDLWRAVIDDGVVASALLDDPDHSAWFWFTLAGLPVFALGQSALWALRHTGELPRFLPWWLLVFALFVIPLPASGFWLFLPQAALAFYVTRRRAAPLEAQPGQS